MPRKKNELKTKGHSEKKVIQKKEPLQLVEQATAIVAETPPQKPGDGSSRSGNKDSTQRQLQYDNEQEDDAVKKLIRPFEEILAVSPSPPLSGTLSTETQRNPEESDERSEPGERAIRKEAEDLGYSEPLKEAFVANNGEQQVEEFPMELLNPSCIFISIDRTSSDFSDVKYYTYCVVDSTSYELCGTNDFRAFLRSICYIGRGEGGRCCDHSSEMTQSVNKILKSEEIWTNGGKLTAACQSFFTKKCAAQIEALMMAAFGKKHFLKDKSKFKQIWNVRKESYDPKNNKPTLPVERQYASWGVRLLYEAWKVYDVKPVVLEIVLQHPYAAVMRAEDEKWKLQTDARESLNKAVAELRAASRNHTAACKKYNKTKKDADKHNCKTTEDLQNKADKALKVEEKNVEMVIERFSSVH